ncbi:Uma2 family endonuclease [Candidatus Poribacteria bacterium]|nr:Uma2 family endonuclease [Candidatus Poribacteria bacterium]MYK21575.1 Uma2 family endonuclease [Candidatus Poribacteria bacterium]
MADTQLNQSRSTLPTAQQRLLTADDLAKQPDDGTRYELVKGVLRKMPPAGFEHGICAAEIGSRLNVHVRTHQLGYVCGAETGFKIAQNPDTVRAPDAAFVSQVSIERQGIVRGYWEGAPDLAVEVISPGDTYAEVAEKVEEWLAAGCTMVWIINPRRETVEVYRSNEDFAILRGTDTLDGGDVVEGFQCLVQDIFV